MSINITDELHAATTKGKIASAKEVYLDGDKENLQQVGDKTHQLEEAIKDISASGGASTANAVSYENSASGMTAVTVQGAVDELSAKDKSQDAEIAKKANASDVDSQMQKEQVRVNAELDKKFNKENIAQEFGDSEDKVVSQFALPFREIESTEWLHLIVDANEHVLFGIQKDGSVEWGAGVPTPIKEKIREVVKQSEQDVSILSEAIDAANSAIAETNNAITSAKNEIYASLNNYQQATNTSISSIQDKKVDKEEGKSLIDDTVKECFEITENEEWILAIVDSGNHLLFGISRETGKPYYPMNDMYHVIQNDEYFALWLDAENHVLMGIRNDGQIVGEFHAVNSLKEIISTIQSDIANTNSDVSEVQGKLKEVDVTLKNIINIKVDKEDGKALIDSDIADSVSSIEDVEERLSLETDSDGKILSYRDNEGIKHENSMQVDNLRVSNLALEKNSVEDIKSALKSSGFDVKTPIDWSDSSYIQIPEPRFAIVNITNIDSMPTSKTQNKKAFLEFWDMQGNYFKKHSILNAQGNSSLGLEKKNIAADLCNDEWIGDDTPKVRFGNWVSQDSFHLKAYYTDFFRGVGAVSYKLYDQIVRTRGNMYDRPWKKALIDMSKIGTTTKSFGNPLIDELSLQTDTGARCFPDGFPCACYLNGKFYGIFSWQLKKHRDNYHMDKSTAEHVHLDGTLNGTTMFDGKENIDWSQFEIRNPKGLYAIGGNKYDADVKQEEIAGDNEVNAWVNAGSLPDGTTISSKIKKNLQMTAKVKKYIQDFADALTFIKSAMAIYEASSKSEEDLNSFKQVYETYFDKDNMIDYMIVSDLIKNSDGFNKNWQWFTYDGKKWYVGLYDCDMSFGGHFNGNQITDVLTSHISTNTNAPNGYVAKYYNSDMISRYKELADDGIASYENIFGLLKDWTLRIGTDFYEEEYKKWVNSPCVGDSVIRDEYWELIKDSNGNPQTDTSETFDASVAYSIGDIVSFGLSPTMGYFKFKCLKKTIAQATNTPHTISVFSPVKVFRHNDNLYRAQKWIVQNTKNMDKVYGYTRI